MTPGVNRAAGVLKEAVIEQVTKALAPRSIAVLVRRPFIDARYPDTSDVDVLAVADIGEFRSERMQVAVPDATPVMIDVASLPWTWFEAPEATAARGWVPHRLLTSDLVYDEGRDIARYLDDVGRQMYRPVVHEKRIKTFLDIGYQTVREIGITWDFPGLALFWLHMAHAACLGAALDGMRRLCPNVYTRPFEYLDDVECQMRGGLRAAWIAALNLGADVQTLIEALTRIHAIVSARFPEPAWPDTIRSGTRCEYRYWLSSGELTWRISVARELVRRHDAAAAVFYLRFCAYAVARLPMLHARACAGGDDVSFLRPEQAVLPELRRLVPEIIDDLNLAFSGTAHPTRADVAVSLSRLLEFRDDVIACLRRCGAPVPESKIWAPHEPPASR